MARRCRYTKDDATQGIHLLQDSFDARSSPWCAVKPRTAVTLAAANWRAIVSRIFSANFVSSLDRATLGLVLRLRNYRYLSRMGGAVRAGLPTLGRSFLAGR